MALLISAMLVVCFGIAVIVRSTGRGHVGANEFAHGRMNSPLHFSLVGWAKAGGRAQHTIMLGTLRFAQPTLLRLIRFKAVMRLLCGMMLLLTLAPAHAAPSEYELKAAFIYQIARFVEWPSPPEPLISAPHTSAPLRLCVLGGNPFGPALDTIRGKPVDERRMEVSLLDMNADIHGCNILFIAAPAEKHLERIAALSRGSGMLTIGDTQGFAKHGAIINFFLENGKIRFEINPEASRRAGLKISSQLLKLARIIQEEAP